MTLTADRVACVATMSLIGFACETCGDIFDRVSIDGRIATTAPDGSTVFDAPDASRFCDFCRLMARWEAEHDWTVVDEGAFTVGGIADPECPDDDWLDEVQRGVYHARDGLS